MNAREKKQAIISGVILIALGIMIFLNSAGIYSFSASWPILLIIISACVLIQDVRDISGWITGVIGVVFIVIRNIYPDMEKLASYVLPSLLIIFGVYILFDYFKKRGGHAA